MAEPIRLIVGLGNPGPKYQQTRHNAGFWFLDALAQRYRADLRPEGKFQGDVARLQVGAHEVWLLRPNTFMNLSGQSIGAMARFYKINPDQILVCHDELDLPPGTVRLKTGGGHGGHNGLRDSIARLGTADFHRLRIGIGHPGRKELVHDYVLSNASAQDHNAIMDGIDRALDHVEELVSGAFEKVMNTLHAG